MSLLGPIRYLATICTLPKRLALPTGAQRAVLWIENTCVACADCRKWLKGGRGGNEKASGVYQAGKWDWYTAGTRVDTFAALHDVPDLPFFGTSDGGGQAEHDVDTPGDIAAGLLEARTASEQRHYRRTQQGIEAIGAACQHCKRAPKHKQLRYYRSSRRVNKLWQESIVEERRFRAEQIHQEAVRKQLGELLGSRGRARGVLVTGQQRTDPKKDEVRCAQVLHHAE